MYLLTNTTQFTTFTRPSPGAATFTLPSPPFSTPYTTISLPSYSTWCSGLHFHSTHTEFLQILSGRALITLGSTTSIYTPSSGIILVPRNVKHCWQRASAEGEELLVREWTDPSDGEKEIFFRNLNSVILDFGKERKWMGEWGLMVQLFTLFWALDNYPILVDLEGWIPGFGGVLERWISWFVLGVVAMVGRALGMRSMYREYTPEREGRKKL